MKIECFKNLDYRILPKLSWKECGFEYEKKLVEWAIHNPEYFSEMNPPPQLEFPSPPSEFEMIPYSENEIKQLELGIDYKFPQDFKELLILFGGAYLNHKNDFIRIRRNKNIEKDILALNKLQKKLHFHYEKAFGVQCPREYFLVHCLGEFFPTIISNKKKVAKVFSSYSYFEGFQMKSESLAKHICNTENSNFENSFYDEMEKFFFSSYTSGQSAKRLHKNLQDDKRFNDFSLKKDDHGVYIEHLDKPISIYVFIKYDNMDACQYERKLLSFQNNRHQKETIILSFSFREIVNKIDAVKNFIFNKIKNTNEA